MADFGKKINPIPMLTIDATTFDGTFLPVDTPVSQIIRILRFINHTDQDVTLSWDGVNSHDFFPALTALTLDVTSNKVTDEGYFCGIGTQFFAQAPVGTGLFIIALYGSETL